MRDLLLLALLSQLVLNLVFLFASIVSLGFMFVNALVGRMLGAGAGGREREID